MSSQAVVRNWRDQDPYVSHNNAIIWSLFRPADMADPDPPDLARLWGMTGFVKHALQGRQTSDYHSHEGIEQLYYILKGSGKVLLDDRKYPVREGDIVYIPPKTTHQMFNDEGDDWMEHLIVSCPVARTGSRPIVRNWRDQTPHIAHNAAVIWWLLQSVDAQGVPPERARLMGMNYVTRQAIQRGKASDYHRHEAQEQVYYVLIGSGTVLIDNVRHPVREGDAVYLPQGAMHQLIHDGPEDWIEYVIFSSFVK